MLTLDTSAVVALASPRETQHGIVAAVVNGERAPLIVPAAALSEMTYMLARRIGRGSQDRFLEDLEAGAIVIEEGAPDVPRIRALLDKYADLALGFADAAVIACAERNGGRVLTLDRRDFDVVARGEGTFTILP